MGVDKVVRHTICIPGPPGETSSDHTVHHWMPTLYPHHIRGVLPVTDIRDEPVAPPFASVESAGPAS